MPSLRDTYLIPPNSVTVPICSHLSRLSKIKYLNLYYLEAIEIVNSFTLLIFFTLSTIDFKDVIIHEEVAINEVWNILSGKLFSCEITRSPDLEIFCLFAEKKKKTCEIFSDINTNICIYPISTCAVVFAAAYVL